MVMSRAFVLVVGLLGAAAALAAANASPPPQSPGPGAMSGAVAWKQVYANSQATYYVGATNLPQAGDSDTETLLDFKIPQVVGSAQVWSVVSRMKLRCGQQQVVTVDNTLYARRMGAGKAIQSQDANDNWHEPEPGSLGELIWSTACGKS
jgi:hypothetical protein